MAALKQHPGAASFSRFQHSRQPPRTLIEASVEASMDGSLTALALTPWTRRGRYN
jgi:hypothetical protein